MPALRRLNPIARAVPHEKPEPGEVSRVELLLLQHARLGAANLDEREPRVRSPDVACQNSHANGLMSRVRASATPVEAIIRASSGTCFHPRGNRPRDYSGGFRHP